MVTELLISKCCKATLLQDKIGRLKCAGCGQIVTEHTRQPSAITARFVESDKNNVTLLLSDNKNKSEVTLSKYAFANFCLSAMVTVLIKNDDIENIKDWDMLWNSGVSINFKNGQSVFTKAPKSFMATKLKEEEKEDGRTEQQ